MAGRPTSTSDLETLFGAEHRLLSAIIVLETRQYLFHVFCMVWTLG